MLFRSSFTSSKIGNYSRIFEITLVAVWKMENETVKLKIKIPAFPDGTEVKTLPANAGDTGWILGLGRSHMPRSN